MLDYIHLLPMYNSTEHYEMPDADKEGTFKAAGSRVQVDRTGKGTVAIDNKGKYRIEIEDIVNKKITADQSTTGTGQSTGGGNKTQGENGTIRMEDQGEIQHQSTTCQKNLNPAARAHAIHYTRKQTHTGQMSTRSLSHQIDTHITTPVNTAINSKENTVLFGNTATEQPERSG